MRLSITVAAGCAMVPEWPGKLKRCDPPEAFSLLARLSSRFHAARHPGLALHHSAKSWGRIGWFSTCQ